MRIDLPIIALLTAGLLTGCHEKTAEPQTTALKASAPAPAPAPVESPILRFHFVGGDRLQGDTNAANFRQVWALPESAALRQEALAKLLRAPVELFRRSGGETTNDFAELFRPLFQNALATESYCEVRGSSATPEVALAVRLSAPQAALWNSNLSTIFSGWTRLPTVAIQTNGLSGWELKRHDALNLLRVVQAGDWLVLGAGQDELPVQAKFLQRIKETTRPGPADTNWLEVTADLPRAAKWLALPAPLDLPAGQLQLTVNGSGEYLRTRGRLTTTAALDWKSEPWIVPTNLIREPLISFTAGQGIAAWLRGCALLKDWQIPPPNQFYIWALENVPFQTYTAFPTPDASNTFTRFAPRAMEHVRSNVPPQYGNLVLVATNNSLNWERLPFVAPQLAAVKDDTGEFLFASLLPNTPNKSPLPDELVKQVIGRTNLVYYDWEITQARLTHWRNLDQLAHIIASAALVSTNAVGQRWLEAISPKLGNTITEVTVAGTNEFKFVRQSHIGLTGFELTAFVEWLNATNFPVGLPHWERLPPLGKTNSPPAH